MTTGLPRMRATAELYITFDPLAVKTDPAADVVLLVDWALARQNMVSVAELHESSGWLLRRFNPALAYMLSQVEDRHVLKGGTSEYPARGFHLTDGDRVALSRFAARLRR